jgi:hypothetical protein
MICQLPAPASLLQHEWPPVNKGSEPQLNPGVCLSNGWKKNSFLAREPNPLFFRPVTGYCRLGWVFWFLCKSVASVGRQGWSICTTVSLWRGDIHYSSLKCDVAIFILTDRTVRSSSVDVCVRVCTFSLCYFRKFLCYESSIRESKAKQSLCLIKHDMKRQGNVGKLL